MLNRQVQFGDLVSSFAGMRSSTTRTTTCWEWRRLPSVTRAHLPVWQRTEWGSWRPQPLSQSEVQNTFILCCFSVFTLTGTLQHLETSRTTEILSLWGLHWQFPPQGPIYTSENPQCWLRQTAEDVDSPWIPLIIYISKCGADKLCLPPVLAVCSPRYPPSSNHPVSKAISQITGAHRRSHTWGLQG